MGHLVDHTTLNRAAKIFMDDGRAVTPEAALEMLNRFGLTISVGSEIAQSRDQQIALLTLVNVARRTFLAGVEVVGPLATPVLSSLAPATTLAEAVATLGGRPAALQRPDWPCALIGNAQTGGGAVPGWRLTWDGWRAGVIPTHDSHLRLSEGASLPLAPMMAAAACAGEVFSFHAKDHAMAGRRAAGFSLWKPGTNWLATDASEPTLQFLPSKLWLIGLGNLGQASAWIIAGLPYDSRGDVQLFLQDYDTVAISNDSTSLLTSPMFVGLKKSRMVADWLALRGFETTIEERKFGEWIHRASHEPGVALCGVDNALARSALDKAGFSLVVEAGLGAGPQGFRNFTIHTLPATRTADQIWSHLVGADLLDVSDRPAYQALKRAGLDACGLTQLASRTVGAPFVGLIAAGFTIAELLRRLHGGTAAEMLSGSVAALDNIELVAIPAGTYDHGHVDVSPERH